VVAPTDTAVALEVTALPVESAPSDESQPEVAEVGTPETELEAAPETVKSWHEHIAEVSDDELLENDRFKSLLARREESARRRIEHDQQIKAGSDQQVMSTVGTLLQGLDSGNLTPEKFQQAAAWTVQAARRFASEEIGIKLPEVLMGNYKIPVEYRERAIEAREQDNGNLDRYAKILIEGAVAAERGTTRLKDIPEGSPLHKDVQSEVARRFEAELKARGIEAQPRVGVPPPTPRGTPTGAAASVPYHLMTIEQRAAMSPAERDRVVAEMRR